MVSVRGGSRMGRRPCSMLPFLFALVGAGGLLAQPATSPTQLIHLTLQVWNEAFASVIITVNGTVAGDPTLMNSNAALQYDVPSDSPVSIQV